ncbi:hypothetical protein GCM10027155_21240 [Acinetobacter apis]|uniref:Uncharacterized protein n=1 Tax=Acinetobacter apis TaxID=1229165 RepID=A0A217EI12_9GAMM|nr:hypothetical protein [Acinetobacter apis]SNQ29997.1 hypothetical protein SAMN05444584_1976 [Acinetobacter apis]
MSNQDQYALLQALEQQKIVQKKLDRILYIVLPIMAFLISMICANLNWQSTIGTFVMLTIALIAVGIQRWSVFIWIFILVVYCLIDNFLSYGTFAAQPLKMQLGTMLLFTIITHLARPYLNNLMQRSHAK